MTEPPSHPAWLEALKRPAGRVNLGDRSDARAFLPPVCTRCHRPGEVRESWLERRRLRVADPGAPGGFRYDYAIREHLLCGPCYSEVRAGRPLHRKRGMRIMATTALAAAILAAAMPLAVPSLLAAFWRNGAAPAGWRSEARSIFGSGRG